MTTIRVHFDGKVFVPDEPVDLPSGTNLEIMIHDQTQQAARREDLEIEIPAAMRRSQEAYWRDLPELLKLKSRKRQWVAYHGDERIGFGRTDVDVYQECLRRGLQRGQFYVGKLEVDPEGIPPWGTLESDRSLFEFTESGNENSLSDE